MDPLKPSLASRVFFLATSCGLFLALALMNADVACTPAERHDIEVLAPAAVGGACVVLRAVDENGATDDVCATAEDLLPLIPSLLESDAGTRLVASVATMDGGRRRLVVGKPRGK